jgi:hypothetical protein
MSVERATGFEHYRRSMRLRRSSPVRATFLGVVAGLLCLQCSDTGLYAVGGAGVGGPDKAEIVGEACVPLAAGPTFPVKVIYAIEGGPEVDLNTKGAIVSALNGLGARFTEPFISFDIVAFHTLATAEIGKFVPPSDPAMSFVTGVTKYNAYQESGPVSIRSPLKLAHSLLSGDMITGCRGTVARTRYLVVLLMFSADTACANPVFNAGIDLDCNDFLNTMPPDYAQCSACELARRTQDLRALATQYGAGEVSVQPVYIRTTADPAARYEANAIAQAGGTELIETDPGNINNALNGINYASLQRSLQLKRLIAFNRNALARQGQILIDSDGDGLSDEDEAKYHTDPKNPDTDYDNINDWIEVKYGMNPLAMDMINGCNPVADTDEDRLYDCEERVLGTDPCILDTDGDGIPDLVELNGGTNPLVPEDLTDSDRDGHDNVDEILAHTDPNSVDIAFAQTNGYGYSISDTDLNGKPLVTVDGRTCYNIDAYNITLVNTLARPNLFGGTTPQGTNDIYLYFMVGRANDPRGTGIGSLFVQQIQFIPPAKKKPKGVIQVTPDDFVLGD